MANGASCSTNSRRVEALVQVGRQNKGSIRISCFNVTFRKFIQKVYFQSFLNNQNETQTRRDLRSQIIVMIETRQNTPRIQKNNDTYGNFQDIGILTRAVNIKKNDCN